MNRVVEATVLKEGARLGKAAGDSPVRPNCFSNRNASCASLIGETDKILMADILYNRSVYDKFRIMREEME